MSEVKLLPCPFCGGDAYLETIPNLASNEYVVCCKNKKCTGFYIGYGDIGLYGTREGAIQAWNTRKPMERIVERLEERTDFLKNCTKYGNKNIEQMRESYSTMMMYEVASLVEDIIDIVKEVGGSCD